LCRRNTHAFTVIRVAIMVIEFQVMTFQCLNSKSVNHCKWAGVFGLLARPYPLVTRSLNEICKWKHNREVRPVRLSALGTRLSRLWILTNQLTIWSTPS
jgi:hypothetical protein